MKTFKVRGLQKERSMDTALWKRELSSTELQTRGKSNSKIIWEMFEDTPNEKDTKFEFLHFFYLIN